jgi:dsDNA-specific endonuclease/ATPase MutS2
MRFIGWLCRLFFQPARAREHGGVTSDADSFNQSSIDVDESDVDPLNPFPEPVRIEISDVFDLHTIAPRDVRRVVEAYLYEAHLAGFRSVRIIHGKGIGVQRETVRQILANTSFVEDFCDAPPEAGGWGATVVHLATKDH